MFTPTKFINFTVQNRAARAATATGRVDFETGIPNKSFYSFYSQLATGHPGLIIMECSFTSQRGKTYAPQLGIHCDDMIQYHQKTIQTIKQADHGVKVCCQLTHAGVKTKNADKLDINTATVNELQQIQFEFKLAAERAVKAGYDCIELHACQGFLLGMQISDYYNKRTDMYNASDYLLLKQVFNATKQCGLPVGAKLQCDDYIAGHTMNLPQAIKIMEDLNFDFVEITGGGGSKDAKYKTSRTGPESYYYRDMVKQLTIQQISQKIPLIVTGGMDMETAGEALNDGATMVGFCRKFIRNPHFLINDDKKCFRCNYCDNCLMKGQYTHCLRLQKEEQQLEDAWIA